MVVLGVSELYLPSDESKGNISKSLTSRRVSKGHLLETNLFWGIFFGRTNGGRSACLPTLLRFPAVILIANRAFLHSGVDIC